MGLNRSKLKATELAFVDTNNIEYIVHDFERQGLVARTKDQLKSALSKLGSNNGTICIVDSIDIDEDLTIPENISLKFFNGGILNVLTQDIPDEDVGTGDGSTTEFSLAYSPVLENSETIYVDGTEQTRNTDYTINYETGVITFTSAPTNGASITADYTRRFKLTINGGIDAGLFQIFSGDGFVTGNPKIEAVYPEWFGAKGDGVTDDTKAVQKATDFGNVMLESIYALSKSLYLSNLVDRFIFGKGSLFLLSHTSVPTDYGECNIIVIDSCDNVTISDIILDGNKSNQPDATNESRSYFAGIYIYNSTNVTIENTTIRNVRAGAGIINGGSNVKIKYNVISDCGVSSDGNICDGIFSGPDATDTLIKGNYISNCTDHGIACDTNNIIVESNRIYNCYAGVGSLSRPDTGSNMYVMQNFIKDCTKPINFFNLSDASPSVGFINVVLEANTIEGSGFTALSITGNGYAIGRKFYIKSNTIKTTSYVGIGLNCGDGYLGEDIIIQNNIIEGGNSENGVAAISIGNVSRVLITSNHILNYDFGIYTENSKCSIKNNEYVVVRDAVQANLSEIFIHENFKDVPRRCLAINGSLINGSITAKHCNNPNHSQGGGILHFYSGSGDRSTVFLDSLFVTDSNKTIYVADGESQSIKIMSYYCDKGFDFNMYQPGWNINSGFPKAGYWTIAEIIKNTSPSVGGYLGWVCVRSGEAAPTWAASTSKEVGDKVVPTTDNGYYYECTVAGTTGSSEPTWPTNVGDTVTDGDVTWECKGTAALFKEFGQISS